MVRRRVIVPFSFRRQLHWAVVVSSILKFVLVWLFEIELALWSGWPRPHISPPALDSWVLGLLWCITMNSSAFCSLGVLEAWTLGTQARVQVFSLWSDLQACWQDEMALFFFLPPSPHPPWSSQGHPLQELWNYPCLTAACQQVRPPGFFEIQNQTLCCPRLVFVICFPNTISLKKYWTCDLFASVQFPGQEP